MEPYAPIRGAGPFAASADLFTALVAELQGPEAAGLTACELEELLAGRGREVLRQMLQGHLDLRAAREEQSAREHGTPAMGTDGITRSRLETGHRRLLSTLFGTVRVTRCAWRRPGVGNACPADAALSLPASWHSHALAALEAARGSFEAAHAAITGRCGPVIGKRQVEQAVANAAGDIAAFYAARVPVPCTASTLLVISADGKGGQPRFRYARSGHAGQDRLEVEDGGDAREGVSGDGHDGDNDVGGEHGNSSDLFGPLAGDADGLPDRLGLVECAKHVMGDVGA